MAHSITLENVHAGYGSVRVLHDVSMRVDDGETVVLLGSNGNGKSTLIKCITGIVTPSGGRIASRPTARSCRSGRDDARRRSSISA